MLSHENHFILDLNLLIFNLSNSETLTGKGLHDVLK
jgi:hypothetical protein